MSIFLLEHLVLGLRLLSVHCLLFPVLCSFFRLCLREGPHYVVPSSYLPSWGLWQEIRMLGLICFPLLFSQAEKDVLTSTRARFQRDEGLLLLAQICFLHTELLLLPRATHSQDAEMKVSRAKL